MSLSRKDGYFGNAGVKILMPSSIQKVADVARMAGYQKQVDEFILSMNRAAEAATHDCNIRMLPTHMIENRERISPEARLGWPP